MFQTQLFNIYYVVRHPDRAVESHKTRRRINNTRNTIQKLLVSISKLALCIMYRWPFKNLVTDAGACTLFGRKKLRHLSWKELSTEPLFENVFLLLLLLNKNSGDSRFLGWRKLHKSFLVTRKWRILEICWLKTYINRNKQDKYLIARRFFRTECGIYRILYLTALFLW